MNRSNKPKPEAKRSAKDATERHQRSRLCAWNPFSGKLIKPACFSLVCRKWRKSEKRSSSSSKEEEASPELPPKVIREILMRLPIKSIGRSRCVSKLFRSLSSTSSFAKSQLDLMTVHRELIVSSHNGNMYALDLNDVTRDSIHVVVDPLKDELPFRRNCVEIYGSSNGLVCVSPYEGLVLLYNPTTRESKLLPECTVTAPSRYSEEFQSYGFGFDHLTNDYKVVKLVADSNNLLHAAVYSLKSDTWRWTRALNYKLNGSCFCSSCSRNGSCFCFNCFRPGLNLNGLIDWVFSLLQEGNRKHKVILAFDITTQEFQEIPYPNEARDCPNRFVVGNLNQRLCLFTRCYELHDDIWVMNEFGAWTRIRINLFYMLMKPVCSTKNSGVVLLVLDEEEMVLYNFETHAWRRLEIQGENLCEGFDANSYVQSLVSPNSYDLQTLHN